MKFVKLICLIFVINCLLLQALPSTAKASVKYVRVTQDGVKLYTNPETKKVTCLLEKSYYLVVLEETDDFYKVELMGQGKLFPKIVGFVSKPSVEIENLAPVEPLYPNVTVTVNQSSAQIRFLPLDLSDLVIVATNTQTMSYYGSYLDENNVTWYYVYFNGYFGYVKKDCVTTAKIPLHPTPLPQKVESTPPTVNTQKPSQEPTNTPVENSTNEVLLIAFAGILATALTCALFLPKSNNDKPNSYYSEKR